ncbi:hypothetical protein GOP47_0023934 [Adiantum capillus-veneris]|uniref:Uncharacterized protein n=1 Tax=Adiantum capillus-veneris TaxID=13818 RepID=A0A9D4U4F9_ADICA|nr:hypothetical protein GOP47_0023934 [Adiantum capillus-veneris]
MFGSPFFIPEQVIQFCQERLAARGVAIEYRYLQEFHELQKQLGGPYKKWEVEVTDLAIGIGMSYYFQEQEERQVQSEWLMIPAVYLLMGEAVQESKSNHVKVLNDITNATMTCTTNGVSRSSTLKGALVSKEQSVDFALLTDEDKESIIMQFLGENDVDAMYGNLTLQVKKTQGKEVGLYQASKLEDFLSLKMWFAYLET